MDMWEAFMKAVNKSLPDAKIVHDRFHVVAYLNKAVDQTRIKESREIGSHEWTDAKKSKWLFLKNPENLKTSEKERFDKALAVAKKTAIVWESKELFKNFWKQESKAKGKIFIEHWIADTRLKGLSAMIKVADMLERKMEGLLNYFDHRITNAIAENLNGKIQLIKSTCRGFRNFENYRTSILFHLGGLNMFH